MAQRQGRSNTSLTLTYRVDGLREVLSALNRLGKEANLALRKRALEISRSLAGDIKTAGVATGAQAAIVAATVKAQFDRVPVIKAGGTTRIGNPAVPAYKLLFASEFGQNRRTGWYGKPRYANSAGMQYQPHIGRDSYWIFRTVDDQAERVLTEWATVADEVVREFGAGR